MLPFKQYLLEKEMRKYWGKHGSGCIIQSKKTKRYLVALRSSKVYEPNTWSLSWGGKIDKGEYPLEAALREFNEELNIKVKIINHPKIVYVYEDKKVDFKYFNYLIVVDDEFEPNINDETSEYKWCKLNEIPDPKHFGTTEILNKKVLF